MKQILISMTLLALAVSADAQAHFEGDSIKIDAPATAGMLDWQVNIQNADNLSQSVWHWSDTGQGTFFSPYCNPRVSLTAFDSSLISHSEWSVDLQRADISVSVAGSPNRKAQVEVSGGDFQLSLQHVAYGSQYTYYVGSQQYWPTGNFQEGSLTAFVPYRVKGFQVATLTVDAGVCSTTFAKLFTLN